jgi:uncharacterized protein (TIGR02118 family)
MVKLVFLCRRRADISHDCYTRRLLDDHVPIALRHHPTLRKYVVNIVEADPADAPALDSIGELSFDSLADYRQRLYDSPAGERVVRADVARFMGAATAYVVAEHVVEQEPRYATLGTRSPGHKAITFLRRRPGLSSSALVDHWRARQAPVALACETLARCAMNVVLEALGTDPFGWDGSEELHVTTGDPLAARDLAARLASHRAPVTSAAATYVVAEYVQRIPGLP